MAQVDKNTIEVIKGEVQKRKTIPDLTAFLIENATSYQHNKTALVQFISLCLEADVLKSQRSFASFLSLRLPVEEIAAIRHNMTILSKLDYAPEPAELCWPELPTGLPSRSTDLDAFYIAIYESLGILPALEKKAEKDSSCTIL